MGSRNTPKLIIPVLGALANLAIDLVVDKPGLQPRQANAVRVIGRAVVLAGLGIAVAVVSTGCGSPPPTAAEFCRVYYQQERQYLAQYGHSSSSQPLQDLADAIGAMSDWVPIFERLDQAAPPSIEPDVRNILDALKQEQQAAGQEFSNPLGALASGLEASMMSSASWDHLATYIGQHCTTRGG